MTRGIAIVDLDSDNILDILLAGNDFGNRAQNGRLSSGHGLLLAGRGDLEYETVHSSGFMAQGDVRRMELLDTSKGTLIVIARNNGPVSAFVIE